LNLDDDYRDDDDEEEEEEEEEEGGAIKQKGGGRSGAAPGLSCDFSSAARAGWPQLKFDHQPERSDTNH
jgi:hypothetical protein